MTADAGKNSSVEQIHGENLTFTLTGSDVNLLGRKHLREFAKACTPYTVQKADPLLAMKEGFDSSSLNAKEIVTLST